MKTVRFHPAAEAALRKHRNVAGRLIERIKAYARNPAAFANNVTDLKGTRGKRLRVGDWRIIFEESDDEILITKIGPRGSIYD